MRKANILLIAIGASIPAAAAILIFFFLTPVTSMQFREESKTAIYFPLFKRPGPLWDDMITYRKAHPSLPWIVVLNPSNGPGMQYNANYAGNVSKLKEADMTILGYVSTGWGARSVDDIKQDIRNYYDWYHVDGIMLDEMVSHSGSEGHYSNITKYARSLQMKLVFGNVGTGISPTYIGAVDSIGTSEGHGVPPINWHKGWHLDYDKSNFFLVAYSQSYIDRKYVSEISKYVGSIYITDDELPDPYDEFPSYFDEVLSALDPKAKHDLKNLTVRSFDILGQTLEGMNVTISSNSSAPTTRVTPFTNVSNSGMAFTITALSNKTHVFDHWENGSTSPSRTLELNSTSIILRAHYNTPSTSKTQSLISVNALTSMGGLLHMFASIQQSNGDFIKSGVTPLNFTAKNDTSYFISVQDYNNLVFDHWENGNTNRTTEVMINATNNAYPTAYYKFIENSAFVKLTVDSYSMTKSEIRGLSVSVSDSTGAIKISEGTPLTCTLKSGATSIVTAQDYEMYVFDHWENGSKNRTRTITPTDDTELSAYYRTPKALLTVNASTISGDPLNRMRVVVTANNAIVRDGFTPFEYSGTAATIYNLTPQDGENYVFDHWENGSSVRSRILVPSSSIGATAYYRPI